MEFEIRKCAILMMNKKKKKKKKKETAERIEVRNEEASVDWERMDATNTWEF